MCGAVSVSGTTQTHTKSRYVYLATTHNNVIAVTPEQACI